MRTGWRGSALIATPFRLSLMTTLKIPPKKIHASSNPSMTSSRRSPKVSQQNMWRLTTEVSTSPLTSRRGVPGRRSSPIRPKSTCSSCPGSPSSTRTVSRQVPKPSSNTQYGCRVRYGTSTLRRCNSTRILVRRKPSSTHRFRRRCWPSKTSQACWCQPPGLERDQHLGHQAVGDLARLWPGPHHLGHRQVPADRLAVHPQKFGCPPQAVPLPAQP